MRSTLGGSSIQIRREINFVLGASRSVVRGERTIAHPPLMDGRIG